VQSIDAAFSLLWSDSHEFAPAEPRRNTSDEDFRRAMSRFATGVTIVTTRSSDGTLWGFTASSFTSLSRTPPLLLVCLARSARSCAAFLEAPEFAVSVLSAGQGDIARLFASRGADKFAGDHVTFSDSGLPMVRDALVSWQCQLETVSAGGDHVILIGRPSAVSVTDSEPLITYDSRLIGCAFNQDNQTLGVNDEPRRNH
jgi:flavin reductase ActVB